MKKINITELFPDPVPVLREEMEYLEGNLPEWIVTEIFVREAKRRQKERGGDYPLTYPKTMLEIYDHQWFDHYYDPEKEPDDFWWAVGELLSPPAEEMGYGEEDDGFYMSVQDEKQAVHQIRAILDELQDLFDSLPELMESWDVQSFIAEKMEAYYATTCPFCNKLVYESRYVVFACSHFKRYSAFCWNDGDDYYYDYSDGRRLFDLIALLARFIGRETLQDDGWLTTLKSRLYPDDNVPDWFHLLERCPGIPPYSYPVVEGYHSEYQQKHYGTERMTIKLDPEEELLFRLAWFPSLDTEEDTEEDRVDSTGYAFMSYWRDLLDRCPGIIFDGFDMGSVGTTVYNPIFWLSDEWCWSHLVRLVDEKVEEVLACIQRMNDLGLAPSLNDQTAERFVFRAVGRRFLVEREEEDQDIRYRVSFLDDTQDPPASLDDTQDPPVSDEDPAAPDSGDGVGSDVSLHAKPGGGEQGDVLSSAAVADAPHALQVQRARESIRARGIPLVGDITAADIVFVDMEDTLSSNTIAAYKKYRLLLNEALNRGMSLEEAQALESVKNVLNIFKDLIKQDINRFLDQIAHRVHMGDMDLHEGYQRILEADAAQEQARMLAGEGEAAPKRDEPMQARVHPADMPDDGDEPDEGEGDEKEASQGNAGV